MLQQVHALPVALGIAVSRTGSGSGSSSTSAGGTYSSFVFVFYFLSQSFFSFRVFSANLSFPTLAYCGFSGDGSRNNYQLAMKCGYSTKNNNSDDDEVLLVV